MTRFENGRVPASALIQLDSGPLHLTSPKAAAMWYALRRNVQAKYGVTLHITPGKNAYRDLPGQQFARTNACAAGNCDSAALPGWSSHGGTWVDSAITGGRWVDAMAFDIGDWAQLKKATFYAEARAVGFIADGITVARAGHDEPWHIIVLDPWGPVPAGLNATPVDVAKPSPQPRRKKHSMILAYYTNDAGTAIYVLFGPGFYTEFTGQTPADAVISQLGGKTMPITAAYAIQLKAEAHRGQAG